MLTNRFSVIAVLVLHFYRYAHHFSLAFSFCVLLFLSLLSLTNSFSCFVRLRLPCAVYVNRWVVRCRERERERVLSLSSTSLNFPRLQRFSSTSLLFSSHSFLRLFFYCWRFVFLLSLYVILFSLFMHFRSSHNFIDFHFNSTDNFFFSTGFWCVFFPSSCVVSSAAFQTFKSSPCLCK